MFGDVALFCRALLLSSSIIEITLHVLFFLGGATFPHFASMMTAAVMVTSMSVGIADRTKM